MLLLTFPDYLAPGQRLAAKLGIPFAEVGVHAFPDRESLVRLPEKLPEHVLVCRSLNAPNDKLIELLLCAKTARCFGAKRLSLVAPYLCYMRQDFASHPGEAISQPIIGRFLADLFDDVITVDPHLHRIDSLRQAIPLDNAVALSATESIAAFLAERIDDAILLGPDSESRQWVEAIAEKTGFAYAVAEKKRLGDRRVEISLPDLDYRQQNIVLVDDMVSTGNTLINAARLLRQAGAGAIRVAVTHALYQANAEPRMREAGIENIWSTDSIEHSSSIICLDQLLAEAVRTI